MVSTQYLHFSSPTPQIISQIVSSKRDSLKLQNLTIVSGVCLFSMRALQSSIDKCRGINVKRLQNIGPTLYEMEYIARSAPVIADLAVLLGETGRRSKNGNSRAQSNRPLTLCLDVPSFHYYQSVDDCLQSHSCTFQEALQWLNAVEKRHEQISHIFRSYINHELSRRCGSSEVCDIRVSPAANLVCSTIHDALARGTRPSLHHVLHMLNEKEPAWATFFRLVPEKEKPHDFRSLGYLFYVFHVVRQALIGNNDETCGHGNDILSVDGGDAARLLISVDDSVERRVYSRAQKILKKIRASHEYPVTPNLLEVYLCRRVFIDGNAKGSNLYLDDPSPELMAPEAPRSVHTYTRHDAPSKSSGLNSLAVVKRIYGADTAAILQELCAEVGLHA
ncbi:hypothetical protein BKA59DRAFT_401028 [Fusarium tricinctum]|uniref:Uncharacterized protein n=1 Tax=Fusarium tricinctum TaxID=61284 RepID=A0A8K0RZJ4_9HYPO|nr:hypothetical protein BKA59DRAFT_401028 [Fusarium tricinctum]